MPVGWFIAPYKRDPRSPRPSRYCAVDDLTTVIYSEGGAWTETEVLGLHAVVKVRASLPTLALVASLPGVTRLPVNRLDDPLSSLSGQEKSTLLNLITSLGYSAQELRNALPGDIGGYTLRDVLMFVASRRRKSRFDASSETFVDDGVVLAPRPVASVDAEVVE